MLFPSFALCLSLSASSFSSFLFNATSTTEFYTLPLHDALPIFVSLSLVLFAAELPDANTGASANVAPAAVLASDRKSTRLNSSHLGISYAVFCLKKKRGDTFTERSRYRGSSQPHVRQADAVRSR